MYIKYYYKQKKVNKHHQLTSTIIELSDLKAMVLVGNPSLAFVN